MQQNSCPVVDTEPCGDKELTGPAHWEIFGVCWTEGIMKIFTTRDREGQSNLDHLWYHMGQKEEPVTLGKRMV